MQADRGFVLMTNDFHHVGFFRDQDGECSEQPYLDLATRFDTFEQAVVKLASISGKRNAPPFTVTPFAEAEARPGVMRHPQPARTALSDLQRRVVEVYQNGEFAHIKYVEDVKGCGNTLLHFLVCEAGDAQDDTEEFIGMIFRAGEQLREMNDAMELDLVAEKRMT